MNIKIVTTYNDDLYKKYAYRFLETYNWPFDVVVYNENENLFDLIPDCKHFVNRNKHRNFKTFRWDAVRFCYKVYSYTHAILNENVDGLIYLDADSVFYKPIDEDFIKTFIHKDECMTSYLGRGKIYTETGFLYFNLNHNMCKNFAKRMQEYYTKDIVYSLKEYHDCEVFDTVRDEFEKKLNVKNHNITKSQENACLNCGGHVQAISCLSPYYDHCKGNRKYSGLSPENGSIK